jgi:phenylalanyl-tRNA synthetase beta chain
MKVPLKWLNDYVPVDLNHAGELVERLTLAGLEVASSRPLGVPTPHGLRVKAEDRGPIWDRDKIIIASVLQVEKHPNADKLKLPTVDYGEGRIKKMVTGAPNINVGDTGQKVILALSGSVLFDGHATPKVMKELKPGKIRGEPSEAMVCSSLELGIDEEHEGIILLDDDAPVGTPAVDYLGDIVIEIDILPNMARCLSLLGVAREVAAISGKTIKLPPHTMQATGPAIADRVKVEIEDPKLSSRYAAALIQGVKIGPSPVWMQYRLTYAGMRPISNVVDITNYVMLEWGQPLHAFDYDKLAARAGGKAPTIIVRPAREGEVLKTLDGADRKLTPDMLVIADTAGPIALAGVMGGLETEVTATTTNVLLESANFDFVSIRRTMRALNLPSEASQRFSKGIHPEMVKPALERAADLMRQHAAGTICQGIVDCYPAPRPAQVVELKRSEIRRILGIDMPLDDVARILRSLEYRLEPAGPDAIKATVPPHRLDVQEGPADLIEDIARLTGYDRLPPTLLADRLPPQTGNAVLTFEERVRDLLVNAGLQESITYALTTPEKESPLHRDGAEESAPSRVEYVRILNPISSERVVMRQTLLAGLLDVAAANLRHTNDVRLYEVGAVFLPRDGAKLPDEPRQLAIVLCGTRRCDFWGEPAEVPNTALDFFDLKGMIETVVKGLHIHEVTYQPSKWPALHPGRSAVLLINETAIGHFGELHPKAAQTYELAGRQVLVAELDLDALRAALPPRFQYTPVPRFPAALRDVAVVVAEETPAEWVAAEIRAAGGELLSGIHLFDVYRGDSIPTGTKSLAYALTYLAADRTLTDKEVDKAHKKIEDRLKHVLKAQIRGKDGL